MVTISYEKNGVVEKTYIDSDTPGQAYMDALKIARKLAASGTYAEITIKRE